MNNISQDEGFQKSRRSNFTLIKAFFAIGVLCFQFSCSQGTPSQERSIRSLDTIEGLLFSPAKLLALYRQQSLDNNFTHELYALGTLTWQDITDQAVSVAGTPYPSIDGIRLGLAQQTSLQEQLTILKMSDKYPHLSDFFREIGLKSPPNPSERELLTGLQALATIKSQGSTKLSAYQRLMALNSVLVSSSIARYGSGQLELSAAGDAVKGFFGKFGHLLECVFTLGNVCKTGHQNLDESGVVDSYGCDAETHRRPDGSNCYHFETGDCGQSANAIVANVCEGPTMSEAVMVGNM